MGELTKPASYILQVLVQTFQNEPKLSVWIKNWQNFLRLHEISKNSSDSDKKAIGSILSKTDFFQKESFDQALQLVIQNKSISSETKHTILKEFDFSGVSSIKELDSTLRTISKNNNEIIEALSQKKNKCSSLENEVESLEKELTTIPIDSDERKELENTLAIKRDELNQVETQVSELEKIDTSETSFQLRESFQTRLGPFGKREIINLLNGFVILLPSSKLPFTSLKNIQTVNCAFVKGIFDSVGLSKFFFSPSIKNNAIPTGKNRRESSKLLTAIGLNENRIISNFEIQLLDESISKLFLEDESVPIEEKLEKLELYDFKKRSFNFDEMAILLKKVIDSEFTYNSQ